MNFYFNPMAFVENLKYLASGWFSIFVVIGVIMLITYVLNSIFSARKKKHEAEEEYEDED